jgi:two-component system NarL family response regulator
MAGSPIRLLCVDDHRIVREGLALIIGQHSDLDVVAMAESGEQAVELFRAHRPDVTLMDLSLPNMSGVDAIRAIRAEDPHARVIVLTMYEGNEDVHRALKAGAMAYLLKDIRADDLVRVIRTAHAGRTEIGPTIEARLAERASHPTLTSRETRIVELMAQGLRNKEIGVTLDISEATVRVHVKNVFAKLGVHERTTAVRVALSRGIVHLP